jgi:predicted  nucleic acid-binding Zn-ribbon protein
MFLLGSVFLPTVNAEIFDIGKKVSETDPNSYNDKFYYYDSGCVLHSNDKYEGDAPNIFDGNTSTGIANFFGNRFNSINYHILFNSPLFINNITVKPKFGGDVSKYYIIITILDKQLKLTDTTDQEKTFKINGFIDHIFVNIKEKVTKFANQTNNYTGYLYFNDVIINYKPSTVDLEKMQTQINALNIDVSKIVNDIIKIEREITYIKENITNIKDNIPSEYNDTDLKGQIKNLTQEINSLKENLTKINNSIPMKYDDSTIKSDIQDLESENILLKQNIGNLTLKLENFTSEIERLTEEIQDLQGKGNDNIGDSQSTENLIQNNINAIFIVVLIVLLLIILKLSMIVFKGKQSAGSEPKRDDILIGKISSEMVSNYKMKAQKLSDDEFKLMLEKKFQKGEMSKDTYNYLKQFLENTNGPRMHKHQKK